MTKTSKINLIDLAGSERASQVLNDQVIKTAETAALRLKVTITVNSDIVEPRFNEVAGDHPNSFVKSKVCYIEVLFHIFYYYWRKEYRSLY